MWEVFNAQKYYGSTQKDYQRPDGPGKYWGPGGAENLFCFGGRLMFGPKEKLWQPILTAHLVGVPVTLFVCYECVISVRCKPVPAY